MKRYSAVHERWATEGSMYGGAKPWIVAGSGRLAMFERCGEGYVVRYLELETGREVGRTETVLRGPRFAVSPDGPIVAFARARDEAVRHDVSLDPGGVRLRDDGRDLERASVAALDWEGRERWRIDLAGSINGLSSTGAGLWVALDVVADSNCSELLLVDSTSGAVRARARLACPDFVALGDRVFFEGARGVESARLGEAPRVVVETEERPTMANVDGLIEVQVSAAADDAPVDIWLLDAAGSVASSLRIDGFAGTGLVDGRRYVRGERDAGGFALVARDLVTNDVIFRTLLTPERSRYAGVDVVALANGYAATTGDDLVVVGDDGSILFRAPAIEIATSVDDVILVYRPRHCLAAFA